MTTLMKKFFLFFAAIVLTVGMVACGGDEPEINNGNPDIETPSQPGDSDDTENPDNPDNPDDPGTATGNYLVVWYSWSGNSESIARDLAELVNGELVEIVPSVPYPDYSATAQRYRRSLRQSKVRVPIRQSRRKSRISMIMMPYSFAIHCGERVCPPLHKDS